MRRAGTLPILAAAAGLLVAAAPSALQGQDVVRVHNQERGWVGISYSFEISSRSGEPSWMVVTEVGQGSPAQRAGIQVGDTLISINGRLARTNFDNVALNIRPGDRIQLVVTRNGRRTPVEITASERPRGVELESSVTLTVTTDSMAETWYRAMDSLRLTLVTDEGENVQLLTHPRGRVVAVDSLRTPGTRVFMTPRPRDAETVDVTAVSSSGDVTLEEVRAPFHFWVFRTEAHDSLKRAMEAFNRDFRELRSREASRLAPITDEVGRLHLTLAGEVDLGGDLSGILKEYAQREAALRRAIDRVSVEAARPRAGYVTLRPQRSSTDTVATDEPEDARFEFFGPLTPYALGQNRVAGAEIVDLGPELAEYFQVDGGVLVVDVLPGTPMAMGGIQPGDVITKLDRVSIRSIQEFRLGLSRATDTVPLTVVRKGERVQLLLHP